MTLYEELRGSLPAAADDLRHDLDLVLTSGSLGNHQRWQIAVACGIACRNGELVKALLSGAIGLDATAEEDARAAASLMGMNNVFYRFRHLIAKDEYAHAPTKLKASRAAKPLGSKLDFELCCLATSAIFGCPFCLASHEKNVRELGASADQVLDAVRIASVIHGVAVALD